MLLRALDRIAVAGARGELAVHLLPCPGRRNRAQARMQVIQASTGGGRDEHAVRIVQRRQHIQQVRLVVDVDLVRHRGHGVTQRGFTGGGVPRIQHYQCEVGALDFHMGATHAFALDGVATVAQASGVDQGQLQAIQADGFAQGVAGGTGDVGDDRSLAASQRIEQ
ncbi:hypothetical protein G6F32_014854 [Rhizopus arrhizus]|nr:hypothetical protein G6F32_014854 [Rhizopus arrhizus]